MSKLKLLILAGIILLGAILRLYLITHLPVWLDEQSAINWIKLPVSRLIFDRAVIDTAHPPGYYVLLKIWSTIFHSSDLTLLRMLNVVFYIFNCLLFFRIGTILKNNVFGVLFVFVYVFSGYSIIFDWQLKQYTFLVTFLLTSIYIIVSTRRSVPRTILFFQVQCIGLVFDYGFIWFAIPACLILMYTREKWNYVASFAVAFLLFVLCWVPISSMKEGIEAISWVLPFTRLEFVLPYFGGVAHHNIVFMLLFTGLFCYGLYYVLDSKVTNLRYIFWTGIVAFIFAYILNLFVPILHVRSLQIVALSVCVCYTYGLYEIIQKYKLSIGSIMIVMYILNAIYIMYTHFHAPGMLLVAFK